MLWFHQSKVPRTRVHYTTTTQPVRQSLKRRNLFKLKMWLCFSLAELQTICQMYWHRIYNLEGDKYELERAIEIRKMEVNYIIRIGNAYDMIWVDSDLVVTTWHDSCTAHRTHAHVAPRRQTQVTHTDAHAHSAGSIICLSFFYSNAQENNTGVLWPHVCVWGPEVGFGTWSQEKRLWGIDQYFITIVNITVIDSVTNVRVWQFVFIHS